MDDADWWLGFVLITCFFYELLKRPKPPERRKWYGLKSLGVTFFTFVVLWCQVPQRVLFDFCKPTLEKLVASAPTDVKGGKELNQRAGPYWVDSYSADSRGGVYFRMATGPDGPDTISYGFVHKPNDKGTPYGNARYYLVHFSGDWYQFSVSNDN